jgi:ABC-type transport system involved in cytochrome bd biosynthesis fused ATPase/permease subunit
MKELNFELGRNELAMVIGPVGCGKSTFLNLLLKELDVTEGRLSNNMTVSFAPQEAWIFEGTVKDNIILGREFDEKKYQKVLDASCLQADLVLLSHGDSTFVGDRGITLSGGQKARVGLARAIYSDVDLYLLDDPLATGLKTKPFNIIINFFLNRCVLKHKDQKYHNEVLIILYYCNHLITKKDIIKEILR